MFVLPRRGFAELLTLPLSFGVFVTKQRVSETAVIVIITMIVITTIAIYFTIKVMQWK